jgi:hypothetical protein
MELWQLGALVGFGVALIVFLVHLAGGSRKAILDSDVAVTRRFREDFPTFTPGQVIRTASGDAGFLLLNDGSTGLVHALGDSFLTRHLIGGSIKSAKSDGSTLSLRFDDFSFPAAAYLFSDAASASILQQRLAP